ncbi:MAG: phenylalanine--tRNA ligase subunit beta [Vicinamibacterales bacterium]|nr:phenylalanine--tRNA ligase subunit beta [Vicinamibacterales bacterium]
MKILVSWLRDFVDVDDTPAEIGRRLSLRGLALEGLEPAPPGVLPPGREGDTRPDAVMDIDVTANRPDCLSVAGVAREVAAIYNLPLRLPAPDGSGLLSVRALKTVASDAAVSVRIDAPDLCGRYAGAVADVAVGPSPAWMVARLQASGVRAINTVVDVTNYVLLELGQPMHAFDHAKLAGHAIVVRTATPGETLVTLDGKTRTLDPAMLLIADEARGAAIGGVMGGADSEVGPSTRRIVFESAWFKPQSVRLTSRRLGLRSEASQRFERGADPTAPVRAMARACALLEYIGAGRAAGTVVDCHPRPYAPPVITLTAGAVVGLLGMDVPAGAIVRILTALGFTLQALPGDAPAWDVTVPGWRGDVRRDVDLIEEVGRHHGFEHLPSTFPAVEHAPPPSDPRIARDARIRRALLGMGFSEAITFAFIDATAAQPFLGGEAPVALANPLSEKFAVMRPSLLPGLVDAVSHNRRRERRDVQLFEIGTAFSAAGERRSAACIWTGTAVPDDWSQTDRQVDFFDLSGVVEQLGAVMDVPLTLAPADRPFLTPGRAADVRAGATVIGIVGALDASLAASRELPEGEAVYVAEVNLDALTAAAPSATRFATPLPRHPSSVRDLALLVDDTLSAATVRDTIRSAAPETLVQVREFDRYQGKGIPDGKVSLAIRLTFRAPERTLTDAEVHDAVARIVARLQEALGAVQR